MNTDASIIFMLLWSAWFFFGGMWALMRLTIGILGYNNGEGKWSGFKSLFIWFVLNSLITVVMLSRTGG